MKKWLALMALPSLATASCLDGVYVFGDALYWKPSTCSFNYVVEDTSYYQRFRNNPVENATVGPVGTEQGGCPRYNWGFRVGLGYLFECDKLDFRIDYTRLKTHQFTCTLGCENSVLWPTWGLNLPPLTSLAGVPAQATNEFDTRYDAGNIELARIKRKACSFTSRTSFGLHLARIKVTRDVSYYNENLISETVDERTTVAFSGQFYEQNKTWGVGPRIAGEIDYSLRWGIGFEGKAGFAVLAGKNRTEYQANLSGVETIREKHTTNRTVLLEDVCVSKPYCCQVFPEFDASVGLNYETGPLCRCITAKVSVGYDFRTYLNVVKSSFYTTQLVENFTPAITEMASGVGISGYNTVVCDPYSLQGLYIRLAVKF